MSLLSHLKNIEKSYLKIKTKFEKLKAIQNKELIFELSDYILLKGFTSKQIIEKISENFYIKRSMMEYLKFILKKINLIELEIEKIENVNRFRK